jgi:excinuclease ABC subunit B
MQSAIEETQRRRRIQQQFNEEHDLTPTTIEKAVGETNLPGSDTDTGGITTEGGPETVEEARAQIQHLEESMQEAANNLEFELAADIRDRIRALRREFDALDDPDDGVEPEAEPEF